MSDLRPSLTEALDAFGVDATVTPPGGEAMTTRAIWLSPLEDDQPVGLDFKRREPRRVLAVPRSDVASAPRGTIITAPEALGGVTKTWRVDGLVQAVDPGHLRLIVTIEADFT